VQPVEQFSQIISANTDVGFSKQACSERTAFDPDQPAGSVTFRLFVPAKILMVFLIVFLMDISNESAAISLGIICCGIYSFIVLNNLRTIWLQSQDKRAVSTHEIQDVSHE